jgi:hypothetical protein
VLLGNAMVAKSGEYSSSFMKQMAMSVGALYYLANPKQMNQ